jgi:hypothetical protein
MTTRGLTPWASNGVAHECRRSCSLMSRSFAAVSSALCLWSAPSPTTDLPANRLGPGRRKRDGTRSGGSLLKRSEILTKYCKDTMTQGCQHAYFLSSKRQ